MLKALLLLVAHRSKIARTYKCKYVYLCIYTYKGVEVSAQGGIRSVYVCMNLPNPYIMC